MTPFMIAVFVLKFFIPAFYSVLFRAFGLGYRSKKSLAIGLAVFTLYTVAVPTVLIVTVGYGMFTHLSTAVMVLGSMSVLIFSTDSAGKTIFLQLTQAAVTTSISVVLNLVRTLTGISYPVFVLILALVCPVIYYFALKIWAKPLRFIADNMYGNQYAMILLPVITITVVYLIPIFPKESFANHPVYCTLLMLGIEIGYLLYIYIFYQNLLKIRRLMNEEAKMQLLEAEIDSYQDSIEAAKQARHDLHHHNAVILEYLDNGKVKDAVDYLHETDHALQSTKLTAFSSNPTMNAVLRVYNRKAQELGIPFAVQADSPADLPMTAPELGALISNLLENAIESCMKVESFRRKITFRGETDNQGVRIEVRNTVSGTVQFENGIPVSTKPGGGTGTRSIRRTVEKHGGMVRFIQNEDMFTVQIMLPFSE